jgi:hypothetical protein
MSLRRDELLSSQSHLSLSKTNLLPRRNNLLSFRNEVVSGKSNWSLSRTNMTSEQNEFISAQTDLLPR